MLRLLESSTVQADSDGGSAVIASHKYRRHSDGWRQWTPRKSMSMIN
jgi:hypothetical protein